MKKMFAVAAFLAVCLTQAYAQGELNKVYDEERDPMVQIDEALAAAREGEKFVVCQVGGNWCPWCLRFADFISNDTTISRLIDENFEYIHVNYNPRDKKKKEQAEALMVRLGRPARFGFPVFVVLDENGSVIHIQDSSFLEEGKGYSKERVLRFFSNWTPKALK